MNCTCSEHPCAHTTNLDPIHPTKFGAGFAALPLAPTVWDDLPNGQHAVTPNGLVFQRRDGLWHMDPWWQNNGDGAEIAAICDNPDEWAYDDGWPRKYVENAHGPLRAITLPPSGNYPHNDGRCRQDSVDAELVHKLNRNIARLSKVLGMRDDWPVDPDRVIDAAVARISESDA